MGPMTAELEELWRTDPRLALTIMSQQEAGGSPPPEAAEEAPPAPPQPAPAVSTGPPGALDPAWIERTMEEDPMQAGIALSTPRSIYEEYRDVAGINMNPPQYPNAPEGSAGQPVVPPPLDPAAVPPQPAGLEAPAAEAPMVTDPAASLGDDAAAAEEVVGHITAADISRGGGLSQVEPEVAAPEMLTPFDESTVEQGGFSHTLPGRLGQGQEWLRGKLGVGDEGSNKLGMALMRGGAALMSGSANFGEAMGEAVNAGLDGFIEADTSIKAEKKDRLQAATDRWKMDQSIKEANQKLALDHARFELDKQEAARARKEGTKTPMEEAIEAAQQAKTARDLGITSDDEGGYEFRYTPTEETPASDFGKLVDDLEDRFDLTRDEAFTEARRLWTERYSKQDAGLGDLVPAGS